MKHWYSLQHNYDYEIINMKTSHIITLSSSIFILPEFIHRKAQHSFEQLMQTIVKFFVKFEW